MLPVLHEAWESKDVRAVDLALGGIAKATRLDDLFVESVAVWSDMVRRFPVNAYEADPSTVSARAAALAAVRGVPSLIAMRACYRENHRDAHRQRGRCGATTGATRGPQPATAAWLEIELREIP